MEVKKALAHTTGSRLYKFQVRWSSQRNKSKEKHDGTCARAALGDDR